MASKPPPMSQMQTAGSPVCMCAMPSKSAKRRARKRAAAALAGQTRPCDIASITVGLTTKSGGVTLTGSKPAASLTPLPGVADALNTLLLGNAVVIHYVLLGSDAKEISGDATASAAMKSTCGAHPAPDAKKTAKIEIETTDWALPTLFSCLWGSGSLGDLVYGDVDGETFAFDSCGLPAGGDATTALSGVAQIAIADEWQGEFRWAQGFHLSFSDETKRAVDLRDGSKVFEHGREYADKFGHEYADEYVEVTKNKATTYLEGKVGGEVVNYAKENSGSIETEARRRIAEATAGDDDEDEEKEDDSIAGRLKKAADAQEKVSLEQGLALTITRNGEDVLDTDGWGETIENVQGMLKSGTDLLYRLVSLLEAGIRIGVPVSLTLKFEADVRLLQGSFRFRAWPEALPVRQAGTYYLADYRKRYEIGATATLATVELTMTATFQIKVLHEWVASFTMEIETKYTGDSKVDFTFANGVAVPERKMGGKIGGSVKGSGELSAAAFYVVIDGEAASGIVHDFTVGFDKFRLVDPRHKVTSEAMTFQATLKWGNKIWNFIGMGSDKPSWQWPEDEPFVMLEEGALNKEW